MSVSPWVIVGTLTALLCGTLVRIVALRNASEEVIRTRMESLKTWWILAIVVLAAAVFGRAGITLVLAIAATLGMHEFLRLAGKEKLGRFSSMLAMISVPLFYAALHFSDPKAVLRSIPVACVLVFGAIRACQGRTEGYIRSTAALVWGFLLFGCCLSHALLLPGLHEPGSRTQGSTGWFVYLILLTEFNDIMQAIVGRRFGTILITPRISPHKSLQGLLGGLVSTILLSLLSAPWLTTLTIGRTPSAGAALCVVAAVLISVSGFLGDINMSGIKRDAGVKDGSQLLPGQGGMIDRIDSLTFTAPVFYYFSQCVTGGL